jgi:23S rRNA (cytidine2498-2'-O)-methyltransferase
MTPNLILTADPAFTELALADLDKATHKAQVLAELAAGIWTVHLPTGFWPLAQQWQKKPPIFARHICPVDFIVTLPNTQMDVKLLERAVKAEFANLIDPELPFSVQTRLLHDKPYNKFALNSALSDAIELLTGAVLNTADPVQVLSVVVTESVAYMGLSLAATNLSGWAGGEHRFAREEAQISRAEFKLLEALTVFDIVLPPRGTALDLGAAPGGWTRVLRQREQYVTAVDPAKLHPSLQNDPKVRHLRLLAEEYLEADPDKFDLIVNDMRLDARDSARLMVRYAPLLYAHGFLLMTFKLPENGRVNVLDHAFNILRPAYHVVKARQLFHNRSEITVYLQPVKKAAY